MNLNKALREMRIKANLTQVAAGAALGVDQTAISQWESGETSPRLERLPVIAKLYQCQVSDLLADNDEKAV